MLCHIRVGIIHTRLQTKIGPILYYLLGGMISLVFLVVLEVVLVLGTPTSTPRKFV